MQSTLPNQTTATNHPISQEAPATMTAMLRPRYGAEDVLALGTVTTPTPKADEVLLRIHGSSINRGDWFMMTGTPYAIRLILGLFRPKSPLFGLDAAGQVVAVGKDVTRFSPGDQVYGEVGQSYAEYICAPEAKLAPMPQNLSFEEAASVPVAACTALQGLRDKGKIRPGDTVLINGASGGVGTFAVQLAAAMGAEVTAVCSGRNADLVRSIGATHVVDYTQEDFSQTQQRYDIVFDLVGSASLSSCTRILTPKGVYISSVGTLGWSLKCVIASLSSKKVTVLAAEAIAADLTTLADHIEAGDIRPVIDRRYTLAELPEAMRYQSTGRTRGKSIVRI